MSVKLHKEYMIALALALVFLITSSCSSNYKSNDWEYVSEPRDITNVGTGTFPIPPTADRIRY